MGCFGSKEVSEAQYISFEIDKRIYEDKAALRHEIKMLLLGAGESGKSTIVKQMKLIHEGSFTTSEKDSYRELIFSSIIESMQAILSAMELTQIALQDGSSAEAANLIQNLPTSNTNLHLNPKAVMAIRRLWRDKGVQTCFGRSREFQLSDSAAYYFDSIDRIGQPEFMPDDQDMLRLRIRTRGISETMFVIGQLNYRLLDVGGQRNERKKWIHCFENVTAIVFLAAISEYDQRLLEDESVNRMVEALNLFDSICNSGWFTKTSMILFLNKIDIFQKKVDHSPIQNYFPDFQPPSNTNFEVWKAGADFFKHKFLSLNQRKSKQVYTHLTCATDTDQIRIVLSHVNDIIIQNNLNEFGLA